MNTVAAIALAIGLAAGVSTGYLARDFTDTDTNTACDIWTTYLVRLSSGDPQESLRPEFLSDESIAWFKDAFAVRNAACQGD